MNSSREVLPGATAAEILSVRMRDFASGCGPEQDSAEWKWVKGVACFEQISATEPSGRGYIVNVSEAPFRTAPLSLRSILKRADEEGFVYVHFGEDTLVSPEALKQ